MVSFATGIRLIKHFENQGKPVLAARAISVLSRKADRLGYLGLTDAYLNEVRTECAEKGLPFFLVEENSDGNAKTLGRATEELRNFREAIGKGERAISKAPQAVILAGIAVAATASWAAYVLANRKRNPERTIDGVTPSR